MTSTCAKRFPGWLSRWIPAHRGSTRHAPCRAEAQTQPSMPKFGCARAAERGARRESNLVKLPRVGPPGHLRPSLESPRHPPRLPQPRGSSIGRRVDRQGHSTYPPRIAGAAPEPQHHLEQKNSAARGGSHRDHVGMRFPAGGRVFSCLEDRRLAPRGTKMTRIRRPRAPRSRARLSRSTGARWTTPRGLAGARRPQGRPTGQAAERGRQSLAPPIV